MCTRCVRMRSVPARRNHCLSGWFSGQIYLFLFFWNGESFLLKKKTRWNSNGAFQILSICFGFLTMLGMSEHKSPKEKTAYIFALSSSQNYPLMFWISKYLFPGAVMRGCTRNQVTQLTKKSLKLQPFVFILLKYLHCDANADFQSKKNISFSLWKLL